MHALLLYRIYPEIKIRSMQDARALSPTQLASEPQPLKAPIALHGVNACMHASSTTTLYVKAFAASLAHNSQALCINPKAVGSQLGFERFFSVILSGNLHFLPRFELPTATLLQSYTPYTKHAAHVACMLSNALLHASEQSPLSVH
jgi:hypothetical protein